MLVLKGFNCTDETPQARVFESDNDPLPEALITDRTKRLFFRVSTAPSVPPRVLAPLQNSQSCTRRLLYDDAT